MVGPDGPEAVSCPVEVTVGGLQQHSIRSAAVGAVLHRAKAVECAQVARWRHFENCARAVARAVRSSI
jgi:hypothetical protein